MNANIASYWSIRKVKLKLKYPDLTKSDLNYNQGKENEMMSILSSKLGKTNQELLSIIIGL
jgi:hypothetical protein